MGTAPLFTVELALPPLEAATVLISWTRRLIIRLDGSRARTICVPPQKPG
jgi:hypothetical protein